MGGAILKTKAFTLIELLAIIVILAIIAVITVPIILNVIDNASRGAAIDSAYGYRDAIQKFYLSKLYDESDFELEDRTYMVSELKSMGLSVSGNEPTDDSWVELREGEVVAFSLKIGNYIVTQYENEEISAIKGTVVADNPELRDRNNAIIKAQDIINNTDITGKNNQIFDIYNGWVAVVNNEVIGYSVKVTENGKNYMVTLDNGTTTCVIGEELSSSDDVMISVIKAQVSSYITELSNDDTIKSLTEDKVLKVSEITTVTKPTGMDDNSWVYIKNNEGITDYSLKIGDYVINYNSTETDNMTVVKDGTIRKMPVTEIVIPVARTIDGVDYYNTEWIGTNPVYYNPTTGASCTDYSESNSNTGNTTGCLKWYAYSEENGNVNLLLDHNTTPTAYWTKKATGPGTDDESFLGRLASDTSGWTGIPNRTDSYTSSRGGYTINYSVYKARIITAQEVANIVGNTSWDETSPSIISFYFDSHESSASPICTEGNTSGCSYGWLYDRTSNSCKTYGCLNNSDVEILGYWTVSSPYSFSASSSASTYAFVNVPRAWNVDYRGGMYYNSVYSDSFSGIRPVITVSKSSIFES